ncbi:transcription elongation factor GreA [candidate division KSB1 bacterium]|nr:transcription elongation factor GreA [candidate division KSB1 bacterium]
MKPVYISQQQHDQLQAELHVLKYTERPKIISAIAEAREHGDLRENAEYAAAKEKQVLVERKISRLEEMLSRARLLDSDQMNSDRVHVGRKVKLIDVETEEEILYELVPSAEFLGDELTAVSVDSPVGKALVGKAIDDIVEIHVPVGVLKYRVTEIL